VVLADFMPLVPDRWLTVTQTLDAHTRRVSVFGNTFTDSSSRKEAASAPVESRRLIDGTIVNVQAPSVAPSSVVEVWVEHFDPAWGEDFGWRRERGAIVRQGAPALHALSPARASVPNARNRAVDLLQHREFEALVDESLVGQIVIAPTLWDGTVTLPPARAGVRFRLAITEYEEYLVDDAMPYDQIPTKKDGRIVFVEYVELG
jgi:hypothetical protein